MNDTANLKVYPAELKYLGSISDLLDTRFRIPGTNIRFGLDFLIGLVPGAGDALTFTFSGALVLAMVRHGASGMVLVRMLFNILVDSVIGAIPVIGDVFDLAFHSNRRNYRLLKEHYLEGKHFGSVLPVFLAVASALLLIAYVLVFAIWNLFHWIFS